MKHFIKQCYAHQKVVVLFNFIVFVTGILTLLAPLLSQYITLKTELTRLNTHARDIDEPKASYDAFDTRVRHMRGSLDEEAIKAQLIRLAIAYGLRIESVEARGDKEKNTLMLEIKTQSQFEPVVEFLRQLNRLPDLTLLQQYQLSGQEAGQIGAFLRLIVYPFTKTSPAPLAPFTTKLNLSHNPFCAPKSQLSTLHATDENVYQPEMTDYVGYLQQGEKLTAILLLPDNRFKVRGQGESLGSDQRYHIIRIHKDQLFLMKRTAARESAFVLSRRKQDP